MEANFVSNLACHWHIWPSAVCIAVNVVFSGLVVWFMFFCLILQVAVAIPYLPVHFVTCVLWDPVVIPCCVWNLSCFPICCCGLWSAVEIPCLLLWFALQGHRIILSYEIIFLPQPTLLSYFPSLKTWADRNWLIMLCINCETYRDWEINGMPPLAAA